MMMCISKIPLNYIRAKIWYVCKGVCVKRVCLCADTCEENTVLTPVISGVCDYGYFSYGFHFRDFLQWSYTSLITRML